MSTVRVNGIDIHYEITDFCDPWRKPETVLLHHGFARNLNFWYRWVHALSCDYRVVSFDSRGCGESTLLPGNEQFSLEQFAADAIGLLDALDIERVHWAGEASGGIVGIVAACRYPQRIVSLTLSNTPIKIPQATNDVFVDAEVLQYGTGYWARKSTSNRLDVDKVPKEWIEWSIEQYDRISPQVAIALHHMLESADSLQLLPGIQAPTLILASERSKIAVREEMEKMTRQIPDGKLVVFEGYGQGITWMIPDQCVAEMKKFIGEIGR